MTGPLYDEWPYRWFDCRVCGQEAVTQEPGVTVCLWCDGVITRALKQARREYRAATAA